MAYIELQKICKSYSNGRSLLHVLDHLDFCIEKGDLISIMGRSGSGKTTLLNILAGIIAPDSGSYIFSGRPINYTKERDRRRFRSEHIGYIMQDIPLLSDRTVWANVKLPLQYQRRDKRMPDDEILNLASQLQIEGLLNERPSRLSGGERQKVGILRALVQRADIILADEPTGSLDEASGLEILDILKGLNQQGKTLIVITHDQTVAGICHTHYVLHEGAFE